MMLRSYHSCKKATSETSEPKNLALSRRFLYSWVAKNNMSTSLQRLVVMLSMCGFSI